MVSPVAVTTGEPAGIGPEVSVKAAFAADFPVTLIGDERFLRETAEKAGLPSAFPANVRFHNIPLAAPVVPGRLECASPLRCGDTEMRLRRRVSGDLQRGHHRPRAKKHHFRFRS